MQNLIFKKKMVKINFQHPQPSLTVVVLKVEEEWDEGSGRRRGGGGAAVVCR